MQAFDLALAVNPMPAEAALAWEGKGLVLQTLDDQEGAMKAFGKALAAAQQAHDQARIRHIAQMISAKSPPDFGQLLREARTRQDRRRSENDPPAAESPTAKESSPSAQAASPTTAKKDADCGCDEDQPPIPNSRIPVLVRIVFAMLGLLTGRQVFVIWRRRRSAGEALKAESTTEHAAPAPAGRGMTALILCLAMVGLGVAGYLTLAHFNLVMLACDDTWFHCDQVAEHPLAHGFGIPLLQRLPTAAFGLAAFALLIGLTIWRVRASTHRQVRQSLALQTVLVLVMCAAFAGLSYAEAFIIHAWCLWCVVTAGITLLLLPAVLVQGHTVRHAQRIPGSSLQFGAVEQKVFTLLTAGGVTICLFALGLVKVLEPRPQLVPNLIRAEFIPAGSDILGTPDTPATLIMFGNYQCTHCRAAMRTVDRLLGQNAGQLNGVFCPTSRRTTYDWLLLSSAAHAAGRQGRYRQMHHALFANQQRWRGKDYQSLYQYLLMLAENQHLNRARFIRDLADPMTASLCAAQQQLGVTHQMFPTPKFVLFTSSHTPVVLHNATQVSQWLADKRHW